MNSIRNLNRISHCVLKSNQFNLFKVTNNVTAQTRTYCDDKEKKTLNSDEKVEMLKRSLSKMRHMDWVTSFGMPNVRNAFFANLYLWLKMPQIDPQFNKEQFMDNCREATIIFCNLIANNEPEQCAELMTNEAYKQLVERYAYASQDQMRRLRLTNENIDFHNLIFLHDFKKSSSNGSRHYVEATLTLLKKNDDEQLKPLYLFSDLIITKFIRDYTNGPDSDTDWIISYHDHKFVDAPADKI